MAETPARIRFKRSFGQANHFLVTIIVGLNSIKNSDHMLPSDLPAAWDPQDARRSAERSEAFAIQGTSVFLVTALDQYLSEAAELSRPNSQQIVADLDAAAKNEKGLRGRYKPSANSPGRFAPRNLL